MSSTKLSFMARRAEYDTLRLALDIIDPQVFIEKECSYDGRSQVYSAYLSKSGRKIIVPLSEESLNDKTLEGLISRDFPLVLPIYNLNFFDHINDRDDQISVSFPGLNVEGRYLTENYGRELTWAFSARAREQSLYYSYQFSNVAALKEKIHPSLVKHKALARLVALIDFDKFGEEDRLEETFEPNPTAEIVAEAEIQRLILACCQNSFEKFPDQFRSRHIHVPGFLDVTGIERVAFLRNLEILRADGVIQLDQRLGGEAKLEKGHFHISDSGIRAYASVRRVPSEVEKIFAEIKEGVDAELQEVSPQSARKLADAFERLDKAEDSSDFAELALVCRLVMQDFTDRIYRSEYLPAGETPPDHAQTRNKVRFTLKAKLGKTDETLRELIEAGVGALEEYFRAVDKHIQKTSHITTGFTPTKEDASRCLIHTYMVIGDILRLLSQ